MDGSPKFMHTPRKGIYQNCIKKCEVFFFLFWIFFFFFFFLPLNMGVTGEL